MKSHKQISIATLLSLLVLTGCTNSTTPKVETAPVSQDAPAKQEPAMEAKVAEIPATSADITKTKEVSYTSPAGSEFIKISITSKDDTITNVAVTPLATNPISLKLQTAFAEDVSKSVVGKTLKGLKVDTVSGASLTTAAFNKFLASSN